MRRVDTRGLTGSPGKTARRLKQAALLAGIAAGAMFFAPAADADPGCHGCSYGTIQDGGRTEPEDNRSPGYSESDNDRNNDINNNNIVVAENTIQTVGDTVVIQGSVYDQMKDYQLARPDKPANDPWNPTLVRSISSCTTDAYATAQLAKAAYKADCGLDFQETPSFRCDWIPSGFNCSGPGR